MLFTLFIHPYVSVGKMQVPNGIGTILGIVQLALYYYYSSKYGEGSREPLLASYAWIHQLALRGKVLFLFYLYVEKKWQLKSVECDGSRSCTCTGVNWSWTVPAARNKIGLLKELSDLQVIHNGNNPRQDFLLRRH